MKTTSQESKNESAGVSPMVNDDAAADAVVAARLRRDANQDDRSLEIPVNVTVTVIADPPAVQYSIRERCNPDVPAVVVDSPDGTIEDAVRAFNARRKEVLTAKQLLITKV